jgi:hypothetical protein
MATAVAARAVPVFAQDSPFALPELAPKPVATNHDLRRRYVWSTLGIDGVLHATFAGTLDQIRQSPTEWGTASAGFVKRWASDYAESAIGDSTKYAVARIFHQDPAFTPCACAGFGRRLKHAVDSPFMGRTRTGRRVLSAASLAGMLAGNVVPSATWYPDTLGTRDGLRHAATSLVSQVGVDVLKEFWPRKTAPAPGTP